MLTILCSPVRVGATLLAAIGVWTGATGVAVAVRPATKVERRSLAAASHRDNGAPLVRAHVSTVSTRFAVIAFHDDRVGEGIEIYRRSGRTWRLVAGPGSWGVGCGAQVPMKVLKDLRKAEATLLSC